MKIEIHNVAKIASAELQFNGITVLVGDNNTGKTTVGRVLHAFFSSFVGIDKRVPQMRLDKCRDLLIFFLRNHTNRFWGDEGDNLAKTFLREGGGSAGFHSALREFVGDSLQDDELAGLLEQLQKIRELSDHEICEQIVTNFFKYVFTDEYMPAKPRDATGSSVRVTIKGHDFDLDLRKDGVHFSTDYFIEHDAYFIDTPDLLEDISQNGGLRLWGPRRNLSRKLVREIAERMYANADAEENAIDDILLKQKLKKILSRITAVIHGKVTNPTNGRVGFRDDDMQASFRLENLSRGVRAFALLQSAIQCRVLKERDVLILDEPEIHLHPQWLMDYAEVLVILQEELDLTILVTTHSAYFLQALQLYARKHDRVKYLNAYKAVKAEDGNTDILKELGSDNWDEAYMSFLLAANKLRRLRDEVMGDLDNQN